MIACFYSEDELYDSYGARSLYPCVLKPTKALLVNYAQERGLTTPRAMQDLVVRDLLGVADLNDRRLLEYAPKSIPRALKATIGFRLNPQALETLYIRKGALGIGFNAYCEALIRRAEREGGLLAEFVQGVYSSP